MEQIIAITDKIQTMFCDLENKTKDMDIFSREVYNMRKTTLTDILKILNESLIEYPDSNVLFNLKTRCITSIQLMTLADRIGIIED